MKHVPTLLAALLLAPLAAERPPKTPNVLFIAVDDLTDWVGCLGGSPQALTPNLDRLAKERTMVMSRAHCPSTVCCPSRSVLLSGRRPSSTGVYGNDQNLKNAAKGKDVVTLPEYFGQHAYHTLSAALSLPPSAASEDWLAVIRRPSSDRVRTEGSAP